MWSTAEHPDLHNAEINNKCLSQVCNSWLVAHQVMIPISWTTCVQCVCPACAIPGLQTPPPTGQAGALGTGQPAQATQLLPEPLSPTPTPGHARPWVPMKDVVTPGPPSPQVFTRCCGHWENSPTTPGQGLSLSQPRFMIPCSVTCLSGNRHRAGMALQHDMVSGSCGVLCFPNLPGDRTLFPSSS